MGKSVGLIHNPAQGEARRVFCRRKRGFPVSFRLGRRVATKGKTIKELLTDYVESLPKT